MLTCFCKTLSKSWLLVQEQNKELHFSDSKSSNKTDLYDILLLTDKL